MTNEYQSQSHANQKEITLVDLAVTFVKRRQAFYVVFLLFIIGGITFALITPKKYEFISLLQLAEKGESKTLNEPGNTIAELANRWLPEYEVIYREQNNEKLPFLLAFSNPENTSLIRMLTVAAENRSDDVEAAHLSLLEKVTERQNMLLSLEQRGLERQIESLNSTIESLLSSENPGAALAEAVKTKVELENTLDSLKPAKVLVTSRQSLDGTGIGKVITVAISAILGAIAGVMSALIWEFLTIVRTKSKENIV